MSKPRRLIGLLGALLLFLGLTAAPAWAQDNAEQRSLQAIIADGVRADGWWDESGTLDPAEMDALVAEHGDEFAFAFTDRSFEVEGEPGQNPAFLIGQATLELTSADGGPQTLLFVTGDQVGGATNTFPFFNIGQVLMDFDRSNAPAEFRTAANELLLLGDTFAPIPEGAADQLAEEEASAADAESGIFAGMRLLIILAIVAGALALASVISGRNKKARRTVTTAGARDDTKAQLQAMSDLILDLDPRVTLANDRALSDRFVDASTTYREVLEKAEGAETGHEIADIRIDISKARWKLDVIDAQLSGKTPPKEPFTRDNSGSAWDSTRGKGNAS